MSEVFTNSLPKEECFPTCPSCHGSNPTLVDVISTEERPWSVPVWRCNSGGCWDIFIGRTKAMDGIANKHAARANKRLTGLLNKKDGEDLVKKKIYGSLIKEEAIVADDHISEVRRSINSFELK